MANTPQIIYTPITPIAGSYADTTTANTWDLTQTFTVDPIIPDEAYSASWDGILEPVTKNAIYDKIETMNLSLYVPYTGATGDVYLGGNKLHVLELLASTVAEGGDDHLQISAQTGQITVNADAIILRAGTVFGLSNNGGTRTAYFDTNTLMTADQTYTFPDTSGTLALTSDPVRLTGYTVGGLPAGTTGDMAYVTDEAGSGFLGVATGGGAITCPVFYDGANWVVA